MPSDWLVLCKIAHNPQTSSGFDPGFRYIWGKCSKPPESERCWQNNEDFIVNSASALFPDSLETLMCVWVFLRETKSTGNMFGLRDFMEFFTTEPGPTAVLCSYCCVEHRLSFYQDLWINIWKDKELKMGACEMYWRVLVCCFALNYPVLFASPTLEDLSVWFRTLLATICPSYYHISCQID